MAAAYGIIELNDCELKLSYNGRQWSSSGFATLSGQSVIFGEQARKQARLQPLVSFSQFWNQLGLAPIQHGNERFRHYADFAYQQLLQLHANAPDCKEVILVVPASFNREQLSLLLGICETCPFKVVGMVDTAVVSVADKVTKGHYLHLDMQLHQCLLTEIKVDQKMHINSADIIAGTGLINLYQHWAKYLCRQFIQQCRFDPMHDAQSEQALYDLLPQLLSNGNGSNEEVQLSLAGKQVKLNRQSLARDTQSLFQPVLKAVKELGQYDGLFVTRHITRVPEIYDQLVNSFTLDDKAIESNCAKHQTSLVSIDGQVGFVTALPVTHSNAEPKAVRQTGRSTHLLWQTNAYPIGKKPIYVSTLPDLSLSTKSSGSAQYLLEPQQHEVKLTLLNGSAAKLNGKMTRNTEVLNLGDQLTLGTKEHTLTLINVIEETNW